MKTSQAADWLFVVDDFGAHPFLTHPERRSRGILGSLRVRIFQIPACAPEPRKVLKNSFLSGYP